MSSKVTPIRATDPAERTGQARIISEVRSRVDAWRGFPLGPAGEPYPNEPPSYDPQREGERPISETTRRLLLHWFRHEPHVVGRAPKTTLFRYWPHQRRLVETFIYLYEALGIRRTEELFQLCDVEALGPQRDPWAKLGGQLATGSGKTKMMSLLIAWAYLNAAREGEDHLGIGRHSVLIAPGLFVRDRLCSDFFPPDGSPSVFFTDPVVPPEFERDWDLKVYSPTTCPLRLDPEEGALIITNYHQLLRAREDGPDLSAMTDPERQMDLLFESGAPERLEAISTPLVERFVGSRGLLVLNDEAHHVWDETGHAQFEHKAREKAKLAGASASDAATAMAWIRCLRRLNGDDHHKGRMALQVDLSATLFEETGATTKKASKGRTDVDFRPSDLFRHTVVHYGLAEAIRDQIVKKPILERVEVKNVQTGEIEQLVREGQPNAWEKYRNLLVTGIQRWKKVRHVLQTEGDKRKPILFVLCSDRNEAAEIANFLTYREATREAGSEVRGFPDPDTGEPMFVEQDIDGTLRSTVIQIHIGSKEEENEEAWEKIRQTVNAIDHDEIPDPSGRKNEDGSPVMIPNPYNVVISVMMLKEGWDVRNVKVIVPVRPCGSRTLTEQTLGRGLRRMHPPLLDEEGGASFNREELFVIEHPSFREIINQIDDLVETKSSDEIDHAPEYVPIPQKAVFEERQQHNVRLVRFEGLVEVIPDWRKDFDVGRLPALNPRLPWRPHVDRAEVNTFLKEALKDHEQEGLHFEIPLQPSYRDLDRLIERAFAIPLLQELHASYANKNAVKSVAREYLEKKTFDVPAGLPLSFDRMLTSTSEEQHAAMIVLCNLGRPEVLAQVRSVLLPAIREALTRQRPTKEAQKSEQASSEIPNYQARKLNVLESAQKSSFQRAAFDSTDELRLAKLLDRADDVVAWVYNHRSGVGYHIEYEFQGYTSRYFPDFILRARFGPVFHNFIIEVKGRIDDRDRAKIRRGQQYAELLTEYDHEPWHYLCLIESTQFKRQDIAWWESQSSLKLAHLLRHHETLPLLPEDAAPLMQRQRLTLLPWVEAEVKYKTAVPVYDLEVAGGAFTGFQAPKEKGWVRIQTRRPLDKSMFVAPIVGRSMEPGIPDGSFALFRIFAIGNTPSPRAIDGRRVLVQLRDQADPDTGGKYTLKRWRVHTIGADGGVEAIELVPDNTAHRSMLLTPQNGDVRAVAEFLEVIGDAQSGSNFGPI